MRAVLCLLFALTAVPTPVHPVAQTARVFVSGHSLTDRPLPDYLERIGASLGAPIAWNRQSLGGSAIKWRARGRDQETGWAGFSRGDNRDGQGMNVVEELRVRPYDVLLITEQHGLVDSFVGHQTVRYLRQYHELMIAGNPRGRTFFYEPWLGIPGKVEVQRWIDYERMASPLWQCAVTRINASLAAEGRDDRLTNLPAGLALAELVERATRPGGLPGISGLAPGATIDRLFEDNVHYRPLAAYYLALVSFGFIFELPLAGAWAPPGVAPEQAASLQRVAAEFVAAYRATNRPLSPRHCQAALKGPFLDVYFAHMRDDHWATRPGNAWRNEWRRIKGMLRTRWYLRSNDPLAWDVVADRSYWLPPPTP